MRLVKGPSRMVTEIRAMGSRSASISTRSNLDDSAGHRVAIMDEGSAVQELLRLASDGSMRSVLGTTARERMQAHHHAAVVGKWVETSGERSQAYRDVLG